MNEYQVASGYATSMFENDPVKLLTSGTIAKAVTSDQIRGVVKGFKWVDAVSGRSVVSPFFPAGTVPRAGTLITAMVIDGPNTIFEAQFTNSSAVPTQIDVGATFSTFDVGGNPASGLSGAGVDYSTMGTGAAPWRFLAFSTNPANDPTSANSYGLFAPALHDFRVNTGI